MQIRTILIIVSAALICGCRSYRESVGTTSYSVVSDTTVAGAGPRMLVVLGSLSYDSITGKYDLTLDRQTITPGHPLKKAEQITANQATGLNYMLRKGKNKTISIHHIDNPLIQEVEYNDGDNLGRKTIHLQKADILWQIAIEPGTEIILFRNGNKIFGSVRIEEK